MLTSPTRTSKLSQPNGDSVPFLHQANYLVVVMGPEPLVVAKVCVEQYKIKVEVLIVSNMTLFFIVVGVTYCVSLLFKVIDLIEGR